MELLDVERTLVDLSLLTRFMKCLVSIFLGRIATISTTRETPRECRQIEKAQDLSRHARVTDPTLIQTSSEVANPRVSLAPVEARSQRPRNEPMQLDDIEESSLLSEGVYLLSAVVVEAMIKGFRVRRIYVNGGSSSEVMYTHCFRNLSYQIRSRLRESRILLVWFSGEVSYSMGVIDSEVTIGECRKTRIVIMEFAMVKSPSPYNALLSRTRMRSLGAVASTIYLMMKFLTLNRIATISTTRETPRECRQIEKAQDLSPLFINQGSFPFLVSQFSSIRGVLRPSSISSYRSGEFSIPRRSVPLFINQGSFPFLVSQFSSIRGVLRPSSISSYRSGEFSIPRRSV
nr:reverse transcriptase domain-containing protein [Tanacetum cinerariifolium]